MPPPTTIELAATLERLTARVAALEAKFAPPDRPTAASELARIANALNQLGPVLASCDLLAARAAAPASPWKPI